MKMIPICASSPGLETGQGFLQLLQYGEPPEFTKPSKKRLGKGAESTVLQAFAQQTQYETICYFKRINRSRMGFTGLQEKMDGNVLNKCQVKVLVP